MLYMQKIPHVNKYLAIRLWLFLLCTQQRDELIAGFEREILVLPNTKFLSLDVPTLHMSGKPQRVVYSADKSFQFV